VHTGIEVTELVHWKCLTRSLESGRVFWFPWDQGTFCAKIRDIIAKKEADGPQWQDGPYDRRLLVIPTDEPYLDQDTVARFLQGQRFQSKFFSDAVLGLPPLPATDFFPTFRVSLGG
jgi:hypothetical protein